VSNTPAVEESSRSFRFSEGKTPLQRPVNKLTIPYGGVYDHPAIVIEPGLILCRYADLKIHHHPSNVVRQISSASAQTYSVLYFYTVSPATAE
jgi:hypothetical protein